MDPVTILSLVCNICQLCEYGAAALVTAKKVYESETGFTDKHEKLQSATKGMNDLAGRLQVISPRCSAGQTVDEKNLDALTTRCREVTREILELLEEMKSKKSHSVKEALKSVTRGAWKNSRMKELQEKLGQVQVEVQLQLTVIMRSESLERLEALITSRKSDTSELASLRDNIQILRAGVRVVELAPEASTQLLHLLQLSSDEIDRKCRDYILKGIGFPSMSKRYHEVETAHHATFTWIFQDGRRNRLYTRQGRYTRSSGFRDYLDGEVQRTGRGYINDPIRKDFHKWLSTGKGIFQIIAKPGAGKSTMMKFICESTETARLLGKWSGTKPLIVAKFFFWKQGTHVQRSIDGMIQSLLHSILSQAPELIAQAFPDQWKTIQSTPWHCQLVPEISITEARQAFRKLFSDETSRISAKYSICIFLDGLDECESRRGSEELISSLHNLASISDSIKLCVSSRALNSMGLIDGAYPQQKMYLHNLTESDIRMVTSNRLHGHTSFQRMMTENKNNCSDLINRITQKAEGVFLWVTLILNILCQGLTDDDTLSDLWEKIEFYPDDLDEFLQQIVRSIPPENRKLAYRTFAVASMMSQHDGNLLLMNYSFLEDYTSNRNFALAIPNDSMLSSEEADTRLARTQKRLVAHCKELLQVSHDRYEPDAPIVSFIHRSVRETFEQYRVKVDMAKYLKDFDVLDAILQTTLAVIKLGHMYGTEDTTVPPRATPHLMRVLKVVKGVQSRCTTTTCESLDSISTAVLHRQGVVCKSFQDVEWSKSNIDLWFYPPIPGRALVPSLVHHATSSGIFSYRDWTVSKLTDLEQNREAATELLWCYVKFAIKYDIHDANLEHSLWIESLFLKGLSANCPRYSAAEYSGQPIWYDLLRYLVSENIVLNSYYWHIFELFVRNGSDCSLKMELVDDYGRRVYRGLLGWGVVFESVKETTGAWELLHDPKLSIVRLQDIVGHYKPENADLLKDLIDRNQARERESPSIVTLSNRDFEEKWKAAKSAGEDLSKVEFRMREPNWDVSPPTAVEKEAFNLKKWAKRGPSFSPSENGIDLALQQTSFSAWIVGFVILGLPVVLLILGTCLAMLVWSYLFSLSSTLSEL